MTVKRLPMASSPPREEDFGMSCWQLTDYLNIRMFRIQGWLGWVQTWSVRKAAQFCFA